MQITDLIDYSRNWVETVAHTGLHGIIVTNIKNETVSEYLKKLGVDLVTMPLNSQVFLDNPEQTTVDLKFFAAREWLKNKHEEYDYLMITDLSDVTILHNPFPFMRGYDQSMGQHQLYIGSEDDGSKSWMQNLWWNCWQESVPDKYWEKPFYNPGILGGEMGVMVEFTEGIVKRLEEAVRIEKHKSCDMQASWTAADRFATSTFTGYPLHTRYKEYALDEGALIMHK